MGCLFAKDDKNILYLLNQKDNSWFEVLKDVKEGEKERGEGDFVKKTDSENKTNILKNKGEWNIKILRNESKVSDYENDVDEDDDEEIVVLQALYPDEVK